MNCCHVLSSLRLTVFRPLEQNLVRSTAIPKYRVGRKDDVDLRFGHGTDAEEQGVSETHMSSGRGSPENDSRQ